ncbi:MAG TPA: hypothetical protein IAB45_04250 [Candidatus Onthousia faecavium]|nr:hypothetical protein [Candidatus Onthousia faecavium]
MSKNKDNTKIILVIVFIIILIIAVVGVSYAAIFYSKVGEKINTVTTGTIMMSYSENNNGINLVDAVPMSDEVGRNLSEERQYFDFSVSAKINENSNVMINYLITAMKDTSSTLPDNAVKVYLTDITSGIETQVLAPTNVSLLALTDNISDAPNGQYVLLNSNFNKTETRQYRLRMWIDDNYSLPGDSRTYKLRVNVYGGVVV